MQVTGRKRAYWRAGCCGLALLFFTLLFFPLPAVAGASAKVVAGIFPTYDQGGSSYGPIFSQHLTTMIFKELQNSSVEPLLLNPGGLYTSALDDWTIDYARQNHTQVVLITVLLNTDMPAKGDFTVRVKGDLVDLKTGNILSSWQSTAPINRHELAAEVFKTYGGEASRELEFYRPSSTFEKQPLGVAARKIAVDMHNQVLHAAALMTSTDEAPTPSSHGGPCSVNFKVSYVAKHSSSKSYDIVVNGKEETLSIADGNLPLMLQSGPVLIQLSVHDSPYKMPKQSVYQANTQIDCSQDRHNLDLEIGPAGEGFLRWQ